jgi:hypothetical protein
MRSLQCEPLPAKPSAFDDWVEELGLFADCNGEEALWGVVMNYAPPECVRYLSWDQPCWTWLLTRARYADATRFTAGVRSGRRMGV